MNEQKTATYLTCTKNRGFQKKHIDVCQKCPSNDSCKEFQAYIRLAPPTPEPDHAAPGYANIHLPDIIEQLTEIRKLVSDGGSTPMQHNLARTGSMTSASLTNYLKMELEEIKSICSTAH